MVSTPRVVRSQFHRLGIEKKPIAVATSSIHFLFVILKVLLQKMEMATSAPELAIPTDKIHVRFSVCPKETIPGQMNLKMTD